MPFKKAQRAQARLRLAINGPAGSGKTYSALLIAKGLVPEGRIGVIDTERGSAGLYSNLFAYETYDLNPPYSPERYLQALKEAQDCGFDVLIIDSLSHAWAGEGGILSMHESISTRAPGQNKYFAWGQVTPLQNKLIDAILSAPMHTIVTMRTKTIYDVEETAEGKKKPVKLGLAPVQRTEVDHEFTTIFDLASQTHIATTSKDRTSLFDGLSFVPDESTGQTFAAWLDSGEKEKTPREVFNEILALAQQETSQAGLNRLWKERQTEIKRLPQKNREELKSLMHNLAEEVKRTKSDG